jgi:hypothetical protein
MERNGQGGFSQGRQALLTVPLWDFPGC